MDAHSKARVVYQVLTAGMLAVILVACAQQEAPTTVPTAVRTISAPTPTATQTPRATTKEPRYGGIPTLSHRADPLRGWDILESSGITNGEVVPSIFGAGSLVRTCLDDGYRRDCPYLAERWEVNADFTQWTFKVRDDVLWHDGKPFSAADIKFWIDLAVKGTQGRQPSTSADKFGPVKTIELLDGNKVRVTLSQPVPAYLTKIGDTSVLIQYPRHLVQPEIEKGKATVAPFDVGLIGLGPFKFKEHLKGAAISVRRFDRYWEKDEKGRQLPYLDGIDWAIIPDRGAVVAAFRTGRLDGTSSARGHNWLLPQMEIVKKEMGDKVRFYDAYGGGFVLSFNTLNAGPWQDVRVRKAAWLAIDRQAMAQALSEEGSRPFSLFYLGSPWANPDWEQWPGYNPATKKQDQAEAKRLLTEAGFPNGFESRLMCLSTQSQECELFEFQLRTYLGIRLTLDTVDEATRADRGCKGQFDLHMPALASTSLFPDTQGPNVASVDLNPCGAFRHKDAKVDALVSRITASSNYDERVKLSRELERYVLLDQAYGIPSMTRNKVFAVRSYVKGVVPPNAKDSDYLDRTTVWLDK